MEPIQTIPQRSGITVKLSALLKSEADKNTQVLTDELLAKTAGASCAPGGRCYSFMQSAIRYCEREYGIVWQRMKKAGAIRRLGVTELHATANCAMHGISRRAKRTIIQLQSARPESLTQDERRIHLTKLAQVGVLAAAASKDMQKRLEARNVIEAPDNKRLLENLIAAMTNGK